MELEQGVVKIAITGGPHTGKTTLFEALKGVYEGAVFVPEPAGVVLDSLDYKASTEIDAIEFCRRCMEVAVAAETDASKSANLLIQDRSLIDTLAYCRRDDCDELLDELLPAINNARYSAYIECDFVGVYAASDHRVEDESEAVRTHDLLAEAYGEFSMPRLYLPECSVDERTRLATRFIDELLVEYRVKTS